MPPNIILNLLLVAFAMLYLIVCRIHLNQIMPIVSKVFSSPMMRTFVSTNTKELVFSYEAEKDSFPKYEVLIQLT